MGCTDSVITVVYTKNLYCKWFCFQFLFILGNCWFFICDCVCGKVGDNTCIWEWSCVRGGVLVPVFIWHYYYSDVVLIIFGC